MIFNSSEEELKHDIKKIFDETKFIDKCILLIEENIE